MRMSPSSIALSLTACFLVLCLGVGLLWRYGDTSAGTGGAAEQGAAMSADEFADAESVVWPPGDGGSASGASADGLPEGWALTTEAGLDIPVPESWAVGRGDAEGEGPVLAETDGGGLRLGRAQVFTHMTSSRNATGAVVSTRNQLKMAGEVAGPMMQGEFPASGTDDAMVAEVTFEPFSPRLTDEVGGAVRGLLYAVEPFPHGAPVLIWWGWPEDDYPHNAADVVTVGVRPAE